MARSGLLTRLKNGSRPARERLMSLRWDLRHTDHEFEVLAIFKNEARILDEWIRHYLHQGAECINLINNNSDDDFILVLEPWIQQGYVRLWHDDRKFSQSTAYADALSMLRRTTKWLLVCDLDEFAYARRDFASIRDYLRTLSSRVSCVQIPWKVYGSSGHVSQPADGVIGNFKTRYRYSTVDDPSRGIYGGHVHCKYIARLSRVRSLCIHRPFLFHGETCLPNGAIVPPSACQSASEELLAEMVLHMNHYQLQSEEHFLRKIKRGSAASLEDEQRRTMEAFRSHDHNDLMDDELAQLSSKE